MRVLVTGARGFLGRRVVRALVERGHDVRALDLPPGSDLGSAPVAGVEDLAADLCTAQDLRSACADMAAVIHLAAQMRGADEEVVSATVEGTRRLLDALVLERVPHVVLASSLSVYDWSGDVTELAEDAPLEPSPSARDGYTMAKLAQEALVHERCSAAGIALAVLRPGILWGPGRELPPTAGQRLGPLYVAIAEGRSLPAVHVDNCADAFAHVLEAGRAGIFNVVDHPEITVGRFVRDHLHRAQRAHLVVPAPYGLARAAASAVVRMTPGPLRSRLPSFMAPRRFAARYRPVRIDGSRLRSELGWRPPLNYQQCLDTTYPGTAEYRLGRPGLL